MAEYKLLQKLSDRGTREIIFETEDIEEMLKIIMDSISHNGTIEIYEKSTFKKVKEINFEVNS